MNLEGEIESENIKLRKIRNDIVGSSVNKNIYIKNGTIAK